MSTDLTSTNQLEQQRRENRAAVAALGFNPYGSRTTDIIRHPDHRRVRHRRMLRQSVHDLRGIHILPASDDHLLDAPGDEQIPVGVEVTGVPGPQPETPLVRGRG